MKTYTFQSYHSLIESNVSATLQTDGSSLHGGGEVVINELLNAGIRCLQGNGAGIRIENERLQGCYGFDRGGTEMHTAVRRLTPLECERLQGYPDGWTDIGEWTDTKGKVHKESTDSARYKALGNSICLPFWKVLAKRISAQYDRDITMGSLFDGIGGFPYVFEQINGKGTARWASEIEEFPIAVTKRHFPERSE